MTNKIFFYDGSYMIFDSKEVNRFMSHVIKGDSDSDCWGWKLSKNHGGYSSFTITDSVSKKKTPVKASRFSYSVFIGEIEKEKCICHTCDNPECVNPKHLFQATHKENHKDMMEKGRKMPRGSRGPANAPHGEKNHNCKITDEQVEEIRKQRQGGLSYYKIAKDMNLSRQHVRYICIFKSRKIPTLEN